MPEVYMQIEWPGATTDRVYSPSSVIRDFFREGETLSVADFETRVTDALEQASQRVREVYGTGCTSAQAEAQRIQKAARPMDDNETVRILEV